MENGKGWNRGVVVTLHQDHFFFGEKKSFTSVRVLVQRKRTFTSHENVSLLSDDYSACICGWVGGWVCVCVYVCVRAGACVSCVCAFCSHFWKWKVKLWCRKHFKTWSWTYFIAPLSHDSSSSSPPHPHHHHPPSPAPPSSSPPPAAATVALR